MRAPLTAATVVVILLTHACADGATGPRYAALRLEVPPSAAAATTVPLAVQPVIQLLDGAGNPVPDSGITVTATVTSGDGRVMRGGSVPTDATGRARFTNLTLGAVDTLGGPVSLQFAAGSSTTAVTVTLACQLQSLSLDTPVSDSLVVGDCRRTSGSTVGNQHKLYDLELPSSVKAIGVVQQATSPTSPFRPVVVIRGPNNAPDRFLGAGAPTGSDLVGFKVLMPPGTVRVLATSAEQAIGPYDLVVITLPEDDDICSVQFHSPLNANQTLIDTCVDNAENIGRFYTFILGNGESIAATVTSTVFPPYISIWRSTPNERLTFAEGTTTASVNHTNSTGQAVIYYIFVGSPSGTATGAFTLSATITRPSAVVASSLTRTDAASGDSRLAGNGRRAPGAATRQ